LKSFVPVEVIRHLREWRKPTVTCYDDGAVDVQLAQLACR
jgi:hypothetical protein